ncbi:MAG TPA: GNAT family N-acetyltransferase [Candidatus Dormibacteraeota bacterium]|jgi:ribosomal protein S18 acetylase RimI-like enzyme|nr:GNAT family N-acetyltransferase [Methylomirabilota bacterium]HWN04917.1 GNAT family N-acetyltransferase [Candidatus Dormibacteraeota bacterium]
MAVVIRPCRPDEGPALLDLWHHADASPSPTDTPEQVDQVIQDPAASVLVAVDNDLLVGSIIGGWDGWRGNIYRLAVLPSYRRRGIARALVAAAEERLAARGALRVSALVEHDHPWAVGFWDSLYEPDPRMIRYVRKVDSTRRPS